MTQITYLFGAGASCNCLPIINQIPDRIVSLLNYLKTNPSIVLSESEKLQKITLDKSKREIQLELFNDFEWLEKETRKHASVDTFAKKLFIKNKIEDLRRLKITLSVYFILEQARCDTDPRYDSFYASILNDSITSFPSNVKIISWNYDYQFELSFANYTERYDFETNQAFLNVVQKWSNEVLNSDSFGIYKLNGTTSLMQSPFSHHFFYTDSLNGGITKDLFEKILENYANGVYRHDVHSKLSFAWENEKGGNSFINKTTSATNLTEVLVVIGYSFPFFNREVDKRIVGNMQHLKKVYFQAPHPYANSIKERFQAIRNDLKESELVVRNDIEQFLLPYEL